jgi:PAT family beta-lactamase induction signal transducer AmpG
MTNKSLNSVGEKPLTKSNPWSWIPSLYFAEGVPYVIVMSVTIVLYKRLGLSNSEIALYTSWLNIPWVIKPFWSPVVEVLRTNRWWILAMQILLGAALAGVAFTLQGPEPVRWSLALFFLMAFSSATHDIAADGFYMLALKEHEQAFFVGIRSTFYRIATIAAQGLLVMLAGMLEVYSQNPITAWSITMGVAAFVFLSIAIYHFVALPKPHTDVPKGIQKGNLFYEFVETLLSFVQHPQIKVMLAFILLYRLPEALLVKITPLFLLDTSEHGGLALTTAEYGFTYGTLGVVGLLLGGIVGGILVSNYGLRKCLWPMVMSISFPNVFYVLLAYYQPESLMLVNLCVFVEQFGYGLGFTAYMLYMMYVSNGKYKTAHYAFCTGLMALGMMLPGMYAGKIQEFLGYTNFFILVLFLCMLTFMVAALVKVDGEYGRKTRKE